MKTADKRVQSASLLDAVPSESGLREAKTENALSEADAPGQSGVAVPKAGKMLSLGEEAVLEGRRSEELSKIVDAIEEEFGERAMFRKRPRRELLNTDLTEEEKRIYRNIFSLFPKK